jgi:hypothetical protein
MQMPHFKRILIWLWLVLYTDFIKKQSGVGKKAPTCMIVELSATKPDDIEDCYYPPAEYNKLLNSQKEVLKRKHKARGHVPTSQDSNVPNNHKKLKKTAKHDFKKVNCNVSAIQQTVNEILKFMKEEKAAQDSADDGKSTSNANDVWQQWNQLEQCWHYSPGMTPNDCFHMNSR